MYNVFLHFWNVSIKKFMLQNNQLLLFGGFSMIIILLSIKLIFGKRTVNCWFCNSNNIVNFSQRNNWNCRKCSQYNGFDKTGNYNKVIDEMYDVGRNNNSNCITQTKNIDEFPKLVDNSFSLCATCNRNQLLKSRQIAKFEPISENCFDQEYKEFKSKLDDLYGVCRKCEKAVKRQIKTQDTMIRGQLKSNIYSKPHTLTSLFKKDNVKTSWFLFVTNICTLILALSSLLSIFPEFNKQFTSVNSDVFKIVNSITLIINFSMIFGNCIYSSMKRSSVYKLLLLIILSVVLLITDQLLISISFLNEHIYIQKLLVIQNVKLISFVVPFFYFKLTGFIIIYSLLLFSPSNTKQNLKNKPQNSLPGSMNSFNESKLNVTDPNETQYSDVSSNSSKEIVPNTPLLDGSLNALNINDAGDAKSPFYKKNHVSNVFFTPPPSRSSSFQSVNNGPQSAILPQRSIVSQKSNFNPKSSIVSHRSIAPNTFGLNVNSLNLNSSKKKSSIFSNTSAKSIAGRNMFSSNQHSGSVIKQSLIKPARFNVQSSNSLFRNKKSSLFNKTSVKSPSKVNWVENSDFEVGIGDSVSQVGLRKRTKKQQPVYSDDEEDRNLITPRKNENCSVVTSHSPRTVISLLTDFTNEKIKKAENSRFCKWMLVFCVLLNFVLLIFVYIDSQEKRKLELEFIKGRSNGWDQLNTKL